MKREGVSFKIYGWPCEEKDFIGEFPCRVAVSPIFKGEVINHLCASYELKSQVGKWPEIKTCSLEHNAYRTAGLNYCFVCGEKL